MALHLFPSRVALIFFKFALKDLVLMMRESSPAHPKYSQWGSGLTLDSVVANPCVTMMCHAA